MARLFYHTMQDNAGNLLFGVSGTMRLAGTGTLATIYGDEALTAILPNPMTNHVSFGSFKCYLGPGSYDFYMAKAGYTFETLTGLQGFGTMAQQNANAVAITGGNITGATGIAVSGQASFAARVAVGTVNPQNAYLFVDYERSANYGIIVHPSADTGAGAAVYFQNTAGTAVGTITTTATVTAYNTTSDARLKHDVAPLAGALDVVRALQPMTHLWKADGSRGYGFLAHEVQAILPDAGIVTGERDAVDDSGTIVAQMMDPSKLVVWLVGACQELAARVEALEARLPA